TFLHHHQKQTQHAGQDGNHEIRPGDTQTRDLQGREDQVTARLAGQVGAALVFLCYHRALIRLA
ncbi:MAG: hypothetical protein OXD38_04190, partial [Aestuariivita sp.]|nr:hypothetical protein [Aestuariivita sp.]